MSIAAGRVCASMLAFAGSAVTVAGRRCANTAGGLVVVPTAVVAHCAPMGELSMHARIVEPRCQFLSTGKGGDGNVNTVAGQTTADFATTRSHARMVAATRAWHVENALPAPMEKYCRIAANVAERSAVSIECNGHDVALVPDPPSALTAC